MKRYIKISIFAVMIAGAVFLEMIRMPIKVSAEPVVKESFTTPTPTVTLTPTATPTMTPTPVPQYSMGKYADDAYAQYIWSKWAPHGNRAQAVALCTNIAEGHLDDNATHVNPGNGTDRGCWQWSDKYHPDVSDEVARNCFKATDLTYDTWKYRMSLGVTDGFQGMWYGYGSNNYNLCMASL